MSNYGPPERYGQPADPWSGQDSWTGEAPPPGSSPRAPGPPPGYGPGYDDPRYDRPRYDEPRYEEPRYEEPRYDEPRHQGLGYGAPPPYSGRDYEQTVGYPATAYQPSTPPPRRGPGGIAVAVVAALAVLVLGGGAFALYLIVKGTGSDTTAGGTTGTTGPTGGAQTAASAPAGTPQPQSSAEGRFAAKGQCIGNDGTDDAPKIRIVKCAPGTFEVLARFDGTIDFKGKCASVTGYQYHYYFDSRLDSLDFVLCMKRR